MGKAIIVRAKKNSEVNKNLSSKSAYSKNNKKNFTSDIYKENKSGDTLYLEKKSLKAKKYKIIDDPDILRKFSESTIDTLAVFELEGHLIDFNHNAVKMFGYKSREDLLNKSVFDLIHKDDWPKIKKYARLAMKGNISRKVQYILLRQDKKKIFIQVSSALVRDKKDKPMFFTAVIKDISGQRRAAKAVKKIGEFTENILESIYNGVWITNKNDKIIYANKATEIIDGSRIEDILNKEIFTKSVHPALKELKQYYIQAKNSLKPVIFDSLPVKILPDNTIYQSGWFIPKIKNKKFTGMICISHDMTARKMSEDSLENERNLFSTLIENIPSIVYIKDRECRFLHCNKALADFLGVDQNHIIGKTDLDLIPGRAKNYYEEEQNIMRTGEAIYDKEVSYSNLLRLKGWGSYTKVPYFDNNKNVLGLIGLNRDITDSKRANEDLQILLNISNGLQQVKTFSDIGKNIFETIRAFGYINNYLGALLIFDPEKGTLKNVYSNEDEGNIPFQIKDINPENTKSFLKIALEQKNTLIIKSNHSLDSLKIDPEQKNYKSRSMVFIPLYNDNAIAGVLYFVSYPDYSIDLKSINFLESIAKYAVISISNLISKKKSEEWEKLLIENDQRYKLATQATKDLIFDCDLINKKLIVSDAVFHIFHIENRDDYNYFTWIDFIHPDDREKAKSEFKNAIDKRRDIDFQCRIIRKDEKIKYSLIKGTIVYGEFGKAERIVGALSDITKMKEIEEELQKSQKITQLLTKHTVKLQEDERKKIVRELHDGINQVIASIKFKIEVAKKKIINSEENVIELIDDAISSLESTISEVRNICQNLRPNILDDFGLIIAVRRYCIEFYEKTKIEVEMDFEEREIRLPSEIEINLYRIFQEALTNIEKHSKATLVNCFIRFFDTEIIAEIKDNGIGFDPATIPDQIPKREHYGLMNMKERVEYFGGEISIISNPNFGTDILIRIPVEYTSF